MATLQRKHQWVIAASIWLLVLVALTIGLFKAIGRRWRALGTLLLLLPLGAMLIWMALWVWPRPATETARAIVHRKNILIVVLSGDLGFHGETRKSMLGLTASGYDVAALDSRTWFHGYDALARDSTRIAQYVMEQQSQTGDQQVIYSGISFGADILPFTLSHFPGQLQQAIIGYALIVPSTTAHFKTDWRAYLDWGAVSRATLPVLGTLPADRLACVYGIEEEESSCPALNDTPARILGLPGGHLLNGNTKLVVAFLTGAFSSHGKAR
jgi:type IV secretory pathway VirJ component